MEPRARERVLSTLLWPVKIAILILLGWQVFPWIWATFFKIAAESTERWIPSGAGNAFVLTVVLPLWILALAGSAEWLEAAYRRALTGRWYAPDTPRFSENVPRDLARFAVGCASTGSACFLSTRALAEAIRPLMSLPLGENALLGFAATLFVASWLGFCLVLPFWADRRFVRWWPARIRPSESG